MRGRVVLAVLGSWSIVLAAMVSAPSTHAGSPSAKAVPMIVLFPLPPKPLCPVSRPTTDVPSELPETSEPMYYGHDGLWTMLWRQGRVIFEPGGPGFVLPDGSLGMKWGWIPFVPGDLTIEGRRLDRSAPPLQSEISGLATTDEGIDFFPTYLIFPTAGCWEVTGRIGETSLTFVTLVVKVGDGPNWRP